MLGGQSARVNEVFRTVSLLLDSSAVNPRGRASELLPDSSGRNTHLDTRRNAMLTRRQFAAASAGLLTGSLTLARATPTFSFALITDTHLGKPGADYVTRMRNAVAEINASPAAFTVFCGDLVDRGEVEANQKRYGA